MKLINRRLGSGEINGEIVSSCKRVLSHPSQLQNVAIMQPDSESDAIARCGI
jgi:hypothetical protein